MASFHIASREELGWDTTGKRVFGLFGEEQFQFEVKGVDGVMRTYRTLELLTDISADKILSRGTRVWKGFDINDKENKKWLEGFMNRPLKERAKMRDAVPPVICVLKDCWKDASRDSEYRNYRRVYDWIEELPENERSDMRQHFLTVIAYQTLSRTYNIPVDELPPQPPESDILAKIMVSASSMSASITHEHSRGAPTQASRTGNIAAEVFYHVRAHDRHVFEEFAPSIDKVMHMGRKWTAITDVLKGIRNAIYIPEY
jgi:hypothetical protein